MKLPSVRLSVVWLTGSLLLAGCAQHPVQPPPAAPPPPPPPPDLHALYERAIADAAVKRPSFVVDLTPITAKSDVQLVTLHLESDPPVNPKTQIVTQPVWVVLPAELAAKCQTRHGDPLLTLEEILGMPPDGEQHGSEWELSLFRVSTKRVFRPCASSPDITAPRCSLEIARANGSQADFVYHQTWSSYQIGGDKPGYPFTGMGWTYDWGPDASPTHVGVSEYVVRPGTRATKVEDLTPQQFCQGADGSAAEASDAVTPSVPSPAAAGPAPPRH